MSNQISHQQSSDSAVELALSPWQTAIYQGNLAFESGDLTTARDHYTVALQLAKSLIEQFANAVSSPVALTALAHCCPALVVAAHNLADTYKVMSKPKKACRYLCEVHQHMALLLIHPSEQVRSVVAHHHYKTYFELVKFAQQFNHQPELIDSVNQVLSAHPNKSEFLH